MGNNVRIYQEFNIKNGPLKCKNCFTFCDLSLRPLQGRSPRTSLLWSSRTTFSNLTDAYAHYADSFVAFCPEVLAVSSLLSRGFLSVAFYPVAFVRDSIDAHGSDSRATPSPDWNCQWGPSGGRRPYSLYPRHVRASMLPKKKTK